MPHLHPLERHRVRAGLSQAEAARLAGVNVKTLRNSEHGYTQLQIPNVAKLAALYGIDPEILLEEVRSWEGAEAAA